MARGAVDDPIKVFRFRVRIDGFVRAGFTEVTGFKRTTDEAGYREGGFNETPQKSAGLTNYGDITFRRGQLIGSTRGGDNDIITWVEQVHRVTVQGNAANYRKELDVEQYNAMNQRVAVWRVFEAWAADFTPFTDLSATSSENSYEEIVVKCEGWRRVS